MVYEAREDSYLLEKHVKKLARGICLDIGTGTGIQANAASRKAEFVIAVDIDQEALAYCNIHIKGEKILTLKSDLFSFFESKYVVIKDGIFKGFKNEGTNTFDTIIFNPPYLPDEKKDRDIALDGGKKGHELIERFMKKAGKFLSPGGIILLIFSSMTGKEKVESIIKENGFEFNELEKIHVFFEDIYCYRVSKK